MAELQLFIDDQLVAARPGETILEGAARVGPGERTPTLCHVDCSPPEGGCRLCVVGVTGADQPVAACMTAVREGMEVTTSSVHLVPRALRALAERTSPPSLGAEYASLQPMV